MRSITARHGSPVAALAVFMAIALAACGSAVEPSIAPASSSPGATLEAPTLTPVPGSESITPEVVPGRIPTTQTDWGEILDALPAAFPAYSTATVAEPANEPVSATLQTPDDSATVAAWYRDTFAERGYGVELSDPLEDGSQVLDAQADLPECRIQMTFRPGAGSTIMTVRVAAACAGSG